MGQREIMLHIMMTLQQQQQELFMQFLKTTPQNAEDLLMESAENSTNAEAVPNEVRTTRTTSSRMSEPFQAEKTPQNMEKMQTSPESYREAEKIARYLYDLKNSYAMLAQNRSLLQLQYDKDVENIPRLDARADIMEDRIEKIKAVQDDIAELKVQRENLPFWAYKRKKELDTKIERAESDVHVAEQRFNSKYHIPIDDAPFEIKRIRNEARLKKSELEPKTAKIAEIVKELEYIDAEYGAQWQLAEKHAYKGLIENLLTQMRAPQISVLGNLGQIQIERTLDTTKNKK